MSSDETILCRSEDCLGKQVMFSLKGQLLVISKEDVLNLKSANLFFTNRNNRLIKNALSSPAVVQIQVTNNCNLLCKHCYVSSGKQKGKEMSDNEIKQLLLSLQLWGGFKNSMGWWRSFYQKKFFEFGVLCQKSWF